MKFLNIKITNFRQYYNTVEFDLSTNQTQNIILIGGKNGYGKTNFLLSIVWCLFGEKISQIDDNFNKEIQKDKNYSSFTQQSINWTAQKEGVDTFQISILIEGVELPEAKDLTLGTSNVLIVRSRNVKTTEEKLSIIDPLTNLELFNDEEEKFHFINDYIIPLEAAKFVFFDAEKIGEIANLSVKEEGNFINDALGKILGLDVYETLIDDLNFFINSLKKEGASKNLQEQIIDKEKSIELSGLHIEKLEEDNAEKLKEIDELKKQIREYDNLISKNSKQGNSNLDRGSIISEIELLKVRKSELTELFNELSEIIPFSILAGKIEEVKSHLSIQEANNGSKKSSKENIEKIDHFIELLFNKPPNPEDSMMSFKDKTFYYEKAKRLGSELYNIENEYQDLKFEHDLNNAEKNLVNETLNLVNSKSSELFKNTIEDFNLVNLKNIELEKVLNKVDADLEEDIILEYLAEKERSEHSTTLHNRKIGENNEQINRLKKEIIRFNQELGALRSKVDINVQNKLRIKETEKYIETLKIFLEEQKNRHKNSLEKTIINELKILMHKLSSEGNKNKLIEDIEVTILPSGQGMKIKLLDQNDTEIRKESLSSGEKQIYISCLIKAILNEAIQSLPIFIDTPLGRLDEEHRDNITKKYYPLLSEQVVLFSTNSEITPKRFKDISNNISKSYLLVNDGINTNLKQGYFNNYENNIK